VPVCLKGAGEQDVIDVVTNLSKLTSLDISHNQVSIAPKQLFTSLSMVKRLDLSHNTLKQVDEGIILMTSLRVLTLSGNYGCLHTLPNDFWKVTFLEELYLRYTQGWLCCGDDQQHKQIITQAAAAAAHWVLVWFVPFFDLLHTGTALWPTRISPPQQKQATRTNQRDTRSAASSHCQPRSVGSWISR